MLVVLQDRGYVGLDAATDRSVLTTLLFEIAQRTPIIDHNHTSFGWSGSGWPGSGWSGSHGFSITKACGTKPAAASFLTFLPRHDNQLAEARKDPRPTRSKVRVNNIVGFAAAANAFSPDIVKTLRALMSVDAFAPPRRPAASPRLRKSSV